jgi:ribosomal protein S15
MTDAPMPIIFAVNVSSKAKKRNTHDPYALAQRQQRKAANLMRQEELKREREAALGDPVRGITTSFVESFDSSSSPATSAISSPSSTFGKRLNYFLTTSELEQSLQYSKALSEPVVSVKRDLQDPAREAEEMQKHTEGHERATVALARIVSLSNGNQKDRTRVNIQRCIETFGRHNTDGILRPRAPSNQPRAADMMPPAEKTPRVGPDTGSSEVQIAILTAKIRVLANALESKGSQKDKVNKRNLRLLVHRRQKLLAYMRRKERGSGRWQYVVETLGLTEGTWEGEITL